jgi:hypothetical protein
LIEGDITVDKVRDILVVETLRRKSGCRTYAAKALGISVRTLRTIIERLEFFGTDVPKPDYSVIKKNRRKAKIKR